MAECVCNEIYDDGIDIIRADGQPTYIGRAAPGYGTDEAKWQVAKLFFDGDGNMIKKIYANGDPGFVHIYTGYAGFTYSWTGA